MSELTTITSSLPPSLLPGLLPSLVTPSYGTILADPPWKREGEKGDGVDYRTIAALPISDLMITRAHCYLWVPNGLFSKGRVVMKAWGFNHKSTIWGHQGVRDPAIILFGIRGIKRMVKRDVVEHSISPRELLSLIKSSSPGPYLLLLRPI
jgi:MT-A70